MPVETPVNPQQKASSSDSKAINTPANSASDRVGTRTAAGAGSTPTEPKPNEPSVRSDDSVPGNTIATTTANQAHPTNVAQVANEADEAKGASVVAKEGVLESSLSVDSSSQRRATDELQGGPEEEPSRLGESSASSGDDDLVANVTADPAIHIIPDGAKAPDDDLPTSGSWPDFFNSLDLKGVIHNVASHFELIQAYDRTLCFAIAPENATLYNERHQRGLASAIELTLEVAVDVLVSIQPTSDNTPARHREILEQQRLKAAQAALEDDDFLSALLTDFDAVVIPNTVRPPLTEL